MKKFLFILIGLLVVLVAVVLVGPSLVDWNAHKDRITAEIRKATGRALTIDGDMSLALLPVPALSAGGVSLANIEGGSPEPMLSLKQLRVRIALLPLLGGRVQIERVSLVEPRILLEVLPDGRGNWEFAKKEGRTPGSGRRGAGAAGTRIQLDDFTIQDGTLVYRDLRGGREERVDALNARIVAETLRGPFVAVGSARFRNVDAGFEATLGRLVDDGAMPISLLVRLAEAGAQAQFTGALSLHPETVILRGRLKAEGGNLAAAAAALSAQAPAPFAREFAAEGDLSIDRDAVSLSDLEFRLGEMEVAGNAAARVAAPHDLRLVLSARQVDLDRLLDPRTAQTGGVQSGVQSDGQSGGQSGGDGGSGGQADSQAGSQGGNGNAGASSAASAVAAWVLPADVAGSVEFTADALIYRGQAARQVRVEASLADGRLTLGRAVALLPGSSEVSLSGVLSASDRGPSFSGRVDAASDNLRGLLRWFDADLGAVPPDRLRRMSLSTRIEASPSQIAANDIDLTVDLSRATGGVILAPRARPGLGIGLAVDSINLDAYLPAPESARQGGQPDTDGAGQDGAPEGGAETGLAFLDLFDANVNLRVGSLTFRGATAKDLRLETTLQGGSLEFRTARVGDLAGSTASYVGRVENLASAPLLDGTLELGVAEPARLARLLGVRPEDLERVPPFTAHAVLTGGLSGVSLDGGVTALGGQFGVVGTALPAATPPSFDMRLTARHPEVVGLAEALVGSLPLEPGLGGIDLQGRFAGTAARIAVSELTGEAGPADLSGRFDLDLTGAAPLVSGLDMTVGVRHADLAALAAGLGHAGVLGPGIGGADIGGRITGALDALMVEGLSGSLGPVRLSGALGLDLAGPAPGVTDMDLALAVDHPDLARLVVALGGPADLPASLGAVALTGRLTGGGRTFRLEDLAGQLGPTTLSGSLAADLGAARPALTVVLQTGELPLEAWLGGASATGKDGKKKDKKKDKKKKKKAAAAGETERWSRESIDLSALGALDADLDLQARALTHDGLRIDDARLEARLDGGILEVRRFAGQVYGGALRVSGRLDARDRPEADFAVTAIDVDLGALLRDLADFDRVSGPVTLNAALTTRGRSEAELVSALAGRGDVAGLLTVKSKTEEKVGSMLLDRLGSRIAEVRGLSDATGLLFNAFADAPATLAGTFTVEGGVAVTQDTRLDGRAATALTRGSVDLPAWRLDSVTDVFPRQAGGQGGGSPLLTVGLRGPLDEPNIKMGGESLRRKSMPLLDPPESPAPSSPAPTAGPKPSSPTPSTTAPSTTPTPEPSPLEPKLPQPEELLKDLLKSFGG